MAISVGTKAAALLVFAFLVAPAIGFGLKRLTGGWNSYGGGTFAILKEEPARGREAPAPIDPAIQAAEVRQMLEAKAARRRESGGPEIDVEAESARLLAAATGAPAAARTTPAMMRGLAAGYRAETVPTFSAATTVPSPPSTGAAVAEPPSTYSSSRTA